MNKDRLKEAMDKRQMSQADLARESGVTKATISRMLAGQRACTVDVAGKIRKAMRLSMRDTISIFLEE